MNDPKKRSEFWGCIMISYYLTSIKYKATHRFFLRWAYTGKPQICPT